MINPEAIWRECNNSLRPSTRTILRDFNGAVRPGEMLREFADRSCSSYRGLHSLSPVVLGSTESGCTTFLKILTNQHDTYHEVQGDILTPNKVATHYRSNIQYSPKTMFISLPSPSRKQFDLRPRLVPHMPERMVRAGRATSKNSRTFSPPSSAFAT